MELHSLLMALYTALRAAFGDRQWWPGDSPFEVMIGAVLTQNTNWANVEKAIAALKRADALDARSLAEMAPERLQELVRPSGYYRQKASRVARLAGWLLERADGDPAGLRCEPTGQLRQELLSLRGIGPETADSILLYALDRPVFVVDTYTMRVTARHGLLASGCSYWELQDLFGSSLPQDVGLFKDFHAQFVELGKRHCRSRARCEGCPTLPVLGEPSLQ